MLCYWLLCMRQQWGYFHTMKTLILQHISALNGRITSIPQHTTYLLLSSLHYSRCPSFGAFPHSLLYVPSAENIASAASNIRLELSTS